MSAEPEGKFNVSDFRDQLGEHGYSLGELRGWMYDGLVIYVDQEQVNGTGPTTAIEEDLDLKLAYNIACFAGAGVSDALAEGVTHILVGRDRSHLKDLRAKVSQFNGRLPRVVTATWVLQSWQEKTLLDEERMYHRCELPFTIVLTVRQRFRRNIMQGLGLRVRRKRTSHPFTSSQTHNQQEMVNLRPEKISA